jgi:hypothetical protein
MPTAFLYLNFLGSLVYMPYLGMGPSTLVVDSKERAWTALVLEYYVL